MEGSKKVLQQTRHRFLFVGQNSGFHGFNNLFKPHAKPSSRLFWLTTIFVSIGGLYIMMVPVLDLGMDVNYTPDTLYLNWTTTFPGFTVCEEPSTKQALRKLNALYPELLESLNYDHRRYLTDLLYARKQCSNEQCEPCGKLIPCDIPWRDIIEQIHKKCEEILSECSYHGTRFPCCEYFRRVDSEHGPCFSFNTLQHKAYGIADLFKANRSTGPANLQFRLLTDAEISIHSPEELSTNNLDSKLKNTVRTYSENRVTWLFSMVEIENDPQLVNEHVHERGCRFLNEILAEPQHTYPVYSYGACQLAKSTAETFMRCGCIHPVRDGSYAKYYCNYTGMNCWNTFEEYKVKFGSYRNDTRNECLPSCVETELTTVHFMKWRENKHQKVVNEGIVVNVVMVSLPTLRYQRNLIRTHLDLVVSVGGIAGLFFSASILSLIEFLYLMFRPQTFVETIN